MENVANPRAHANRYDQPNNHASANNNTYSISSAMTGNDFDANYRIA